MIARVLHARLAGALKSHAASLENVIRMTVIVAVKLQSSLLTK